MPLAHSWPAPCSTAMEAMRVVVALEATLADTIIKAVVILRKSCRVTCHTSSGKGKM